MRKSRLIFRFIHCGILVVLLLLVFSSSPFPPWQQIFALQAGNTDRALGDLPLYIAWNYSRGYTLQTENLTESSITNSSGQEAIDRSLILQDQSDNGTRLDPDDISRDEDMLTPELVTEELRLLNSTQITDYPLQELSSDGILATFNLLSDAELQKVLGNTKPENLQIIFAKIPGQLHELILNRLDSNIKSYVENSIGRSAVLP